MQSTPPTPPVEPREEHIQILQEERHSGGKPLEDQWYFNHPPREEQIQLLRELDRVNNNDDTTAFINLEAPVGTGKSPVAMTFAQACSGTVLVPQNMLQKQYLRDWPNIDYLKGSVHYMCNHGTKDHPSCQRFRCDSKNVDEGQCPTCPYVRARDAYSFAQAGMTSYAMFFAQLVHTQEFATRRPWMVADESHNMDEAIISAAEVAFDENEFHKLTRSLFPILKTRGRDKEKLSLGQAEDLLNRMWHGIVAKIGEGEPPDSPDGYKLGMLRDSISKTIPLILREGEDNWACDIIDSFGDNPKKFWIKPVLPTRFYKEMIKSRYKVLALSATPAPSRVLEELYRVNAYSFAVKSPFPIENRPIYYKPVAKMSYNNLELGRPRMSAAINKIVGQFEGEKGIIHCSSFKLGADLFANFDAPTKRRVILHRQGDNKDNLLERFYQAEGGAVLMSPSITEGLDLKDNLGRFNIIAKVPYPALGDPWITARRDRLTAWYDWKTALALSQASGRTTRHAEDWSDTIILDTCFGYFYDGARDLFPEWFQEALRS